MKKTMIIGAVCACSMLLTGCGISNLYKEYKPNLDYTFGDYTVENVRKDEYFKQWTISFTDKDGNKCEETLTANKFNGTMKYLYSDKEHMNTESMYKMYIHHLSLTSGREFAEKVLSKELDVSEDMSNYDYTFDYYKVSNDDCTIKVAFTPCSSCVDVGSGKFYEYAKKTISAENGLKLSEAGLLDAAKDEMLCLVVIINLNDGVDEAPYEEKLDSIVERYEKLIGEPLNYTIAVTTQNSQKVLFRRDKLLGEKKIYEGDTDVSLYDVKSDVKHTLC